MLTFIRRIWQTVPARSATETSALAVETSADWPQSEEYDAFDENSLPTSVQSSAGLKPHRHLRSEMVRLQAIDLLASPDVDVPRIQRLPTGAARGPFIPGSLQSLVDVALRESRHRSANSVVAWANVMRKSSQMGISRRTLVDLRIKSGKTVLQRLIATKDYRAFVPLVVSLPDGAYSGGKMLANESYFGEAIEGKPNGLGVFFHLSSFYTGDVFDGKEHGRGDQYFGVKPSYSGAFAFGTRQGPGVYKFSDGIKISASFKQGLPAGQGNFYRSGVKTVVFFIQRDGACTFKADDGRNYEVAASATTELSLCEVFDCPTNASAVPKNKSTLHHRRGYSRKR